MPCTEHWTQQPPTTCYWVHQKVHLGFSILCYGEKPEHTFRLTQYFSKTQETFTNILRILGHKASHHGFPRGSEVKASASNVGDLGSIPGLGRSPGEGNGNPLQYSCLENPMDGGAW